MNYSEEITAELDEINHEFTELGLDTRPAIVLPGTATQSPAKTLSFPLLKAAAVGLLGGLFFILLHYYLTQ